MTANSMWEFAAASPGKTAIVEPDGALVSFAELAATSNRISNALIEAGVGEGDRIAVMATNCGDVLAVILAAAQIGAYFTLLNSRLSWPEAGLILGDAAPAVFVVDGAVAVRLGLEDDGAGAVAPLVVSLDPDTTGQYLHHWISGQPSTPPLRRIAGAPIFYTSGTSGRPKGVQPALPQVSPEATLPTLLTLLTRHGFSPAEVRADGVHLMTSPAYHAAPMYRALLALHLGHTVVIMTKFDALSSLRLIERHRVTWTQVVPTMMQRWMALPAHERSSCDTSSLRWLFHAGAPCSHELKAQMIDWLGPIIYEYYSSTEVGGTVIDSIEWTTHRGSVGRPWPGTDVKILDESRQPVPTGEPGSVYFLSPLGFTYRNDPLKTANARHGEYVTVGDIGFLDGDGYLYLLDRRDDLILRGGVNIYPAEIEATLRQHSSIADVAVIGVPDAELGHKVHAAIVPVEGADPVALRVSVHAFSEASLASHKHPRSLQICRELPYNEAGKLLRRVLRDEYDATDTYPC